MNNLTNFEEYIDLQEHGSGERLVAVFIFVYVVYFGIHWIVGVL